MNAEETREGVEREPLLTVDDVVRRVAVVNEAACTPDVAHLREDDLYLDTLRAIAAGAAHPEELAAAALRAESLDFARWYM